MAKSPVSPETGKPMVRGVRPMALTCKGASATVEMPGWYCPDSDEAIFTRDDVKVSDAALKGLRIKVQN
ncbi:MAG: hypothetical protein Q8M26_13885 [Pseudolabrys sp.]|nr:hypothetical protein [Pseudolabrys sp.]